MFVNAAVLAARKRDGRYPKRLQANERVFPAALVRFKYRRAGH